MNRLACWSLLLLWGWTTGCGDSGYGTVASGDAPAPAATPAPHDDAADPSAAADPFGDTIDSSGAAPTFDTPPSDTPEAAAPDTEVIAAEAGVGVRGQSLEPGSLITEPARAFFRVEQRVAFQQVEAALRLYQAEHGKYPATFEEFLAKIIEPNGIDLPTLPRGSRYIFNGETGELQVERPR